MHRCAFIYVLCLCILLFFLFFLFIFVRFSYFRGRRSNTFSPRYDLILLLIVLWLLSLRTLRRTCGTSFFFCILFFHCCVWMTGWTLLSTSLLRHLLMILHSFFLCSFFLYWLFLCFLLGFLWLFRCSCNLLLCPFRSKSNNIWCTCHQ